MATDAEIDQFRQLWADEKAAAHLYRGLADLAEGEQRALFVELAATEERHADHWAALLRDAGCEPTPDGRVPWRTRLLLLRARRMGVAGVLPAIIRSERSDRDRYRTVAQAPASMAVEEAEHGRRLALSMAGDVPTGLALAEGRHRTGTAGPLRAAVFGVNDGLVSNLALIMGVAGGTDSPQTVVLAGVAGLVAGAGSMAAGEWISVRSQRELLEREIDIERRELEHFPDDERRELELIYRAKGVDEATAAELAAKIMSNPETALDTLVREELGLDPTDLGSPWSAAIASFFSFAAGAAIPLLPFLLPLGANALVVAAVLSGLALAGVGAAISLLTGRPALISAARMLLVGGMAAAVTYLVGTAVGVNIG